MKLLKPILTSSKTTIALLFIFAFSMAIATFIENDLGTQAARTLIYNTWWFEILLLLLCINFFAYFFKHKLFKKEKFPSLLFHTSFIIIIVGATISRYFAYEGIMRIREGASSNTIISDKNYLQLKATKLIDSFNIDKEIYFSPLKHKQFSQKFNIGKNDIKFEVIDFIVDAKTSIIPSQEDGIPIINIAVSNASGKKYIILKKEETKLLGIHDSISFKENSKAPYQIWVKNNKLKIKANHNFNFFNIKTEIAGVLKADSTYNFKPNTLYNLKNNAIILSEYLPKGKISYQSNTENTKENKDNIDDIILCKITTKNRTKTIPITYRHGYLPKTTSINIDNINFKISYGSKPIQMDFSIALNNFELTRYPGSTSPSYYASNVTILEQNNKTPFKIYMNNVLDYKGYRFFQASYDSDEKGTVLSVNHDRPGTIITYIGYLLMGLGMFLNLFGKKSRFAFLNKKLKELNKKQHTFILVLLISMYTSSGFSQKHQTTNKLIQEQEISKIITNKFGSLMVQDLDGRIKPINTLASEFVRKICGKSHYKKLDANQVFLGIHVYPEIWKNIPFIKIDRKKGSDLYKHVNKNHISLISYNDLIHENGESKLLLNIEKANTKKPSERTELDKEALKTDERFNILHQVFLGNYLKIFPRKEDKTKTWYSYTHNFENFNQEDAKFAKGIIPQYFYEIKHAKTNNNQFKANNVLSYISIYQTTLASDIIPSKSRIQTELLYNKLNLNFWSFIAYFSLGTLLLIIAIIKIVSANKIIQYLYKVFILLTIVTFITQTSNLILRWYISQHAPWSNGYEMLIFVSWAIMAFGYLFHKKSIFVLPLATLFSGTLLFVSYLDWINPEITNLMPVLKSQWLKIHVATIISSYAPLAISALLGFLSLALMATQNKNNSSKIKLRLQEISYINEILMTVGLFLLCIGTFLGAVWANESWGRYWAWDPKETWSLISIVVYTIVLHLRLIPKLNFIFILNLASVIGFYAIIMTSFGVNYYLTGLHSYASGDPIPIPNFIYVMTAIVTLTSIIAYRSNNKYQNQ